MELKSKSPKWRLLRDKKKPLKFEQRQPDGEHSTQEVGAERDLVVEHEVKSDKKIQFQVFVFQRNGLICYCKCWMT